MSCGDKISILSGKCKLKTRTHMGKLAPTWENPGSEPVEDQMPVCLVATRFHLVEGMCKLKTRTHMGKPAPTWENLQHVLAMAASGRGFRKLIRLLENAVAMAVETAKAELKGCG